MNFYSEMMLRSFFEAEATAGRFGPDERARFAAFARIYLLGEEEEENLFALVRSEAVRGITSAFEYRRFRRMKQYLAMRDGVWTQLPEDEVADLKGAAFEAALSGGLMRDTQEVRSVACETLMHAAERGSVRGLMIAGVMQTEGIVFLKDERAGLSKLRRAADWNSVDGLLAALRYDPANRAKYATRLRECLKRSGHKDEFARAEAVYGPQKEEGKREFFLLEKAFDQGIVKREAYTKAYARLIYSEVLPMMDKEALVLSGNGELFAEAGTLPLKLGRETPAFDLDALFGGPVRKEIAEKLALTLKNADLRTVAAYRPLCIVSDSRFLLDFYAGRLAKSMDGAHIEYIEAEDLTEHDLEPTKSNLFVRSCDEDAFNAYFLFFRGDVSERDFDALKNVLESAKRAKLRLNRPSVSLDLSAILPICFCDADSAALLRPYCDVLRIPALTKAERSALAEEILRTKGEVYGVHATMCKEVSAKLSEFSADAIEKLLDTVILEHREAELVLTEELMAPYFRGASGKKNAYGFGGAIHETRE